MLGKGLPLKTTLFLVLFLWLVMYLSLRHWNTGLVSSGATLTSLGEDGSLALVGHISGDGTTIKMSYRIDVLHRPASNPIFSY